MMRQDEERKKTKEKEKLKKKKKIDNNIKKQAQKEKEQAQKSKQAEKNPYSVFVEKDKEEFIDNDFVVFTEPLPLITSQKTHCHDYH